MTTSLFGKLNLHPAYRTVALAIEQKILAGELKVGDRLPSETELSRQFGVHRSTVREGLRLLEQGGMVTRVGRMTLEITLPHFQQLASRASRALAMHRVTFRELWEASMLTEPAIATAAVATITADQIDELARNLREMESAYDDTIRFVQLDIEFHDIIAKATRNKVLAMMREPISLLFLPAGQIMLPRLKTHERVVHAHRNILDALVRRDRASVEDWMTRHMADFRRGYLRTGFDPEQPLQPLVASEAEATVQSA